MDQEAQSYQESEALLQIKQPRVDLYLINSTGDMVLIYENLSARRATRLSREWLLENHAEPVVLWPSGSPVVKKRRHHQGLESVVS